MVYFQELDALPLKQPTKQTDKKQLTTLGTKIFFNMVKKTSNLIKYKIKTQTFHQNVNLTLQEKVKT